MKGERFPGPPNKGLEEGEVPKIEGETPRVKKVREPKDRAKPKEKSEERKDRPAKRGRKPRDRKEEFPLEGPEAAPGGEISALAALDQQYGDKEAFEIPVGDYIKLVTEGKGDIDGLAASTHRQAVQEKFEADPSSVPEAVLADYPELKSGKSATVAKPEKEPAKPESVDLQKLVTEAGAIVHREKLRQNDRLNGLLRGGVINAEDFAKLIHQWDDSDQKLASLGAQLKRGEIDKDAYEREIHNYLSNRIIPREWLEKARVQPQPKPETSRPKRTVPRGEAGPETVAVPPPSKPAPLPPGARIAFTEEAPPSTPSVETPLAPEAQAVESALDSHDQALTESFPDRLKGWLRNHKKALILTFGSLAIGSGIFAGRKEIADIFKKFTGEDEKVEVQKPTPPPPQPTVAGEKAKAQEPTYAFFDTLPKPPADTTAEDTTQTETSSDNLQDEEEDLSDEEEATADSGSLASPEMTKEKINQALIDENLKLAEEKAAAGAELQRLKDSLAHPEAFAPAEPPSVASAPDTTRSVTGAGIEKPTPQETTPGAPAYEEADTEFLKTASLYEQNQHLAQIEGLFEELNRSRDYEGKTKDVHDLLDRISFLKNHPLYERAVENMNQIWRSCNLSSEQWQACKDDDAADFVKRWEKGMYWTALWPKTSVEKRARHDLAVKITSLAQGENLSGQTVEAVLESLSFSH